MKEARESVLEELTSRGGHKDRRSGAYTVPEEDGKEPARTERLLAHPFQLWRPRPADAFQSREGFFMFRVNGATFIGRWYRVFVVLANMVFGLLSGLQPLLPAGSTESLVQTAVVLSLQASMAVLCWRFAPDADRIISTFAATQFTFEAFATASVLAAGLIAQNSMETPASAANTTVDGSGEVSSGPASQLIDAGGGAIASVGGAASVIEDLAPSSLATTFQTSGFLLSLVAMGVPMLQLLEQRAVTPLIGIVANRGCNILALLAALYMLAASLPRKVGNLIRTIAGAGDMEAGQAAGSASADAGDDAVEAEANTGSAGGNDGGAGEGSQGSGGGDGGGADGSQGVSGEELTEAAIRASRLLARATAAKEAGGRAINLMAATPEEGPATT